MFIKKILLIHPDKYYSNSICELLSKDFVIKRSNNYTDAVVLLGYYKPELILLDLRYSANSNRFSTLIKLKKDIKVSSIPVIVLSDINDEGILSQALALGATDYYIKDSDLFHLAIKVNIYFTNQLNRIPHFSDNLIKYHAKMDKITLELDFKNKFDSAIDELIFEADVSTNLISKKMLTSVSTLERWTKKVYGVSPMKYMVNSKLDRAMYLLEQNTYKVKEVVHLLGFSSISYFSSCFKKRFGQSPSSYKVVKELQGQ